jgi:hypothetical protein
MASPSEIVIGTKIASYYSSSRQLVKNMTTYLLLGGRTAPFWNLPKTQGGCPLVSNHGGVLVSNRSSISNLVWRQSAVSYLVNPKATVAMNVVSDENTYFRLNDGRPVSAIDQEAYQDPVYGGNVINSKDLPYHNVPDLVELQDSYTTSAGRPGSCDHFIPTLIGESTAATFIKNNNLVTRQEGEDYIFSHYESFNGYEGLISLDELKQLDEDSKLDNKGKRPDVDFVAVFVDQSKTKRVVSLVQVKEISVPSQAAEHLSKQQVWQRGKVRYLYLIDSTNVPPGPSVEKVIADKTGDIAAEIAETAGLGFFTPGGTQPVREFNRTRDVIIPSESFINAVKDDTHYEEYVDTVLSNPSVNNAALEIGNAIDSEKGANPIKNKKIAHNNRAAYNLVHDSVRINARNYLASQNRRS